MSTVHLIQPSIFGFSAIYKIDHVVFKIQLHHNSQCIVMYAYKHSSNCNCIQYCYLQYVYRFMICPFKRRIDRMLLVPDGTHPRHSIKYRTVLQIQTKSKPKPHSTNFILYVTPLRLKPSQLNTQSHKTRTKTTTNLKRIVEYCQQMQAVGESFTTPTIGK